MLDLLVTNAVVDSTATQACHVDVRDMRIAALDGGRCHEPHPRELSLPRRDIRETAGALPAGPP
ncbi:hypothetical protein [Geodermatophilus chilensis]|jgi:hypothetical protein|uniref:hypothetical protein n=1 Tax=Geodermatophilus chilensis TaxID=2035835 RepID=UPI000C267AA1|nr:hypothetical protein [Geodermatophilus chilensis]